MLNCQINHKFQEFIDYTEKIFGKDSKVGYSKMDIDVHGGLSFSEKITEDNIKDCPQGFSLGSWIGWDYGHYNDKTKFNFKGKEWTEKEVEKRVSKCH